jgi:GNAT superfamily N-acetyltransferase
MNPRLVPLDPSRLDALMALSVAAQWNQNEADWRGMLARGRGWGVWAMNAEGRDELAASTVVLPYEDRFAWISMVLVLPAWRGRGFARRLLEVALDDLARRGLTPVLDATPAGHPVYVRQGFVDSWGFARWRRPAGMLDSAPAMAPHDATLRPLRDDDWPAIVALDAPAFGASRLPLLRGLAARLPAVAWVAAEGARLRGIVFGREGRTASQIGPLVAEDGDTARGLLQAALHSMVAVGEGRLPTVVVDLRDDQPAIRSWLQALGFAPERPFTRMVRGAAAPGDPRRVVLVAGPELG